MNSYPEVDVHKLRAILESTAIGPSGDDDDGAVAFLRTMTGELPKRIYHYTSADGAFGIIEKCKLWASHSSFMNDTTEWEHGIGRCIARLRERTSGEQVHFTNNLALVLGGMTPESPDAFDAYVACFCDSGDNLPQWRGYAVNGAGYALGFALDRIALSTECIPLRVIYSPETRDAILDVAMEGYVGVLTRSLAKHPNHAEETSRQVGLAYLTLMTQVLLCFKDEMFAHEREWRLVEFVHRRRSDKRARVQFRAARGAILPYLELALGNSVSDIPLEEVRCGPTAAKDISRAGLEAVKAHWGMTFDITESLAPVRF